MNPARPDPPTTPDPDLWPSVEGLLIPWDVYPVVDPEARPLEVKAKRDPWEPDAEKWAPTGES